tara:strand:- start:151 stop:564 length:414 start_codon:yes stop_codon:yes gene_type:complete
MSASRRLAKLKRSSVVNDVEIPSANANNVVVGNVKTKKAPETSQRQQRVNPLTVLGWHEQRLDKVEDRLAEIGDSVNPELIVSLVETIEEMEKKLTLLNEAYNTLLNDKTKYEVKNEVNNNSKSKKSVVKLNINEKN